MGTPSYIAKQIGDDAYLTIYCHLDGHLHSTGALLAEHYSTAQQVDALLALGDIYCLGSKMNPDADYPHDIEHGTQKDVTVAYARDYGETGYDASVMDIDEMLDGETSVEYLYIFTQDNRWKYLACRAEEMEVKDVMRHICAAAHYASNNLTRFYVYKEQSFMERLNGKELTAGQPEQTNDPKQSM